METNKTIKTTFLRKFLVSIFGIEKYEQVAESTVPSFIKYLFILAIIASILIVPSIIQITVKATDTFQNFVNENFKINYVRILGFNKKGQELLKEIKNKTNLEIVTTNKSTQNLSNFQKNKFEIEQNSRKLYKLFTNNKNQTEFISFLQK